MRLSEPGITILAVPTSLMIKLNARLRPLDRGDIYEDPLQEFLDARLPGSEISGGGTMMAEGGEPAGSGHGHRSRRGSASGGWTLVVEALESFGAPKGSTAHLGDSEPSPSG